jgi:hypothetical protein
VIKYLKAEVIKLFSLRSTWVCIGLVVLFAVGIGLLASGSLPRRFEVGGGGGGGGGRGGGAFERLNLRNTVFENRMFIGLGFSQLVVMVLGVLVICNEYRYGVIRTTFTAAPRRWRVVIAKFISVGALAAVVGTVTVFATYFATYARMNPLLAGTGVKIGIGDPDVLRALVGSVVFFVAAALFAMAIGALVRNQIAAIAIVLLYPTIVETIIRALLMSSDSTTDLAKYLPYNAGSAIGLLDQTNTDLPPLGGLALFVGVSIVLLLIAGFTINHRDA